MRLNGKRVELVQLRTEMVVAGIQVNGLGMAFDDLFTYTAAGVQQDLPPSAQAVLDAHVPPAAVPRPDVSDASADTQIQTAVQNLRTYLNTASPTAAESTAALKTLIRVVIWILRRFIVAGLYP